MRKINELPHLSLNHFQRWLSCSRLVISVPSVTSKTADILYLTVTQQRNRGRKLIMYQCFLQLPRLDGWMLLLVPTLRVLLTNVQTISFCKVICNFHLYLAIVPYNYTVIYCDCSTDDYLQWPRPLDVFNIHVLGAALQATNVLMSCLVLWFTDFTHLSDCHLKS